MCSPRGSWFDAWLAAASGPNGFWPRTQPAEHFRTASTSGPELATALLALLDRRPGLTRLVEVGAGDGRLLTALHRARPALVLAGTDLRARPAGLAPAVRWALDRWDVRADRWSTGGFERLLAEQGGPTLLVAVEWLDDLPCRLAEPAAGQWRELDVDLRPAGPLAVEDREWAEAWWPAGDRVEVGTTRDRAWAALVRALRPFGGQALMVDYGHERSARPIGGSLAGYRGGRRVAPVPAADRNLTAHVAVDAVEAAGEEAGAHTRFRSRQADVVTDLLPAPAPSADVLDDLAARSRRAALASPHGGGSHWWLLQEVPGLL